MKKEDKKREDSERMEEGVKGAGRRQREEENKKRRNVEKIGKDRKKHGADRKERKNVLVKSREGRGEKDCRV